SDTYPNNPNQDRQSLQNSRSNILSPRPKDKDRTDLGSQLKPSTTIATTATSPQDNAMEDIEVDEVEGNVTDETSNSTLAPTSESSTNETPISANDYEQDPT
ncbi:hypothetical protein BGX27_001385, partial [Mortierella sp. AM989]